MSNKQISADEFVRDFRRMKSHLADCEKMNKLAKKMMKSKFVHDTGKVMLKILIERNEAYLNEFSNILPPEEMLNSLK